ncbi:MAG: glycogen synthase [Spirochaetales bacterium]|nr:glycogen synthase [Spirochaetales bacterium]
MNIVMLTSEITPYAKTGGLGDVVASLSDELAREGHNVYIFLPHYSWITQYRKTGKSISFIHGFREERFDINYIEKNGNSGKQIYLLKNDVLFDREGVYSDRENRAYSDNIIRFSAYTRACLEAIAMLEINAEVMHLHDWAPGLACLYMKNFMDGRFSGIRTVLTIHNIGYQGVYGISEINATHLLPDMLPDRNELNFLKIAVSTVDRITTVSPTYAQEIKTPELGHGLENLLKEREKHLQGILNGVDYQDWDPGIDPFIPCQYTAQNAAEGKLQNKKVLQKKAGLKTDGKIPLVAMITRLAEQKGIGAMFRGPDSALRLLLAQEDMQFVILGTGEQWCEQELGKMNGEYKNFHAFIEFNNELSHLIEASADFFLMPSIYEPCGLNQIYSLRYGAVPVVRKTGGLADTIIDENDGSNANGFVFREYSAQEIIGTVSRALRLFRQNRARYNGIQKNGMGVRFTWEKSVHEYLAVYSDF